MTITVENLAGDMEGFDETIRHLIARNWTSGNTEDVTPTFLSPHGRSTDASSATEAVSPNAWMMHINGDLIRFKERNTVRNNPGSLGNIIVQLITTVRIDIFAETNYRKLLFAEEINRIIFENMPRQTNRIKKSDNTNDSAIATFDTQQIEFAEIGSFEDSGIVRFMQGELGCLWQKRRS